MATLTFIAGLILSAALITRRWAAEVMAFVVAPVLLAVFLNTALGLTQAPVEGAGAERAPADFLQIAVTFAMGAGVGAALTGLPMLLLREGDAPAAKRYRYRRPLFNGAAGFAGLSFSWPRFRLPFLTAGLGRDYVDQLYFATAVKLGALTAAADGRAEAREFAALKKIFDITEETCPEAEDLYQRQLRTPQSVEAVIRPFARVFGAGAGAAGAETLIFGMVQVALADGAVSRQELAVIRQAADLLGIGAADAVRILAAAGFGGGFDARARRAGDQSRARGQEQARAKFGQNHQQNNQRGENTQRGGNAQRGENTGGANDGFSSRFDAAGFGDFNETLTERDRHLAKLGLSGEASPADIRKAWRHLASKYHPDKLAGRNVPAAERRKAEAMMKDINGAYEWLKAH